MNGLIEFFKRTPWMVKIDAVLFILFILSIIGSYSCDEMGCLIYLFIIPLLIGLIIIVTIVGIIMAIIQRKK